MPVRHFFINRWLLASDADTTLPRYVVPDVVAKRLAEPKVQRIMESTPLWAETFGKIVDKDRNLVPFVYKPGQLAFDETLEAQRAEGKPMRIIVLKARKVGISSATQAKLIHRCTFCQNYEAIVVAQDERTGEKLYEIGERLYTKLPEDPILKPALGRHRRAQFLRFVGDGSWMHGDAYPDSSYLVDTASSFQSGRGMTPSAIHASEVAFWPQVGTKLTSLKNAMPRSEGTLFVIESTANGFNEFKDIWDDAEAGRSSYAAFFWPWWREAEYRLEFINPNDRERFIVGDPANPYAEQEPDLVKHHGLTLEQLNWRRQTIADECNGDVRIFHQEYPACLTAEMRVSTEEGIIPICQAAGSRETESGPIECWGPQPASQIYRLRTAQGRTLRGTHDHPVQTTKGLKRLSRLQPGDEIELRPPRFAAEEFEVRWDGYLGAEYHLPVTPELGRFIGYFMGDGSWYKDTLEFTLDAKDDDVVEDVAGLVERLMRDAPHRGEIARVKGRKGCKRLRLSRKEARPFMRSLGLLAPNGSGSWKREVCVPYVIWQSPRPVVREFLRGLFETDGSSTARKVRFATSKRGFAEDVQLLLLGFGINAVLQEDRKAAGNGSLYWTYVLDINTADARRFHDEIGFIGARKRAGRPEEKTSGRPALPRPLVDRVESVVEDGFEVTYDFTIGTDDHLFMAQGIVTHNTPREAFISTGKKVFDPYKIAGILLSAELTDPKVPTEENPGPIIGDLSAAESTMVSGRTGGQMEVPTKALWTPRVPGAHAEGAPWKLWLERDSLGNPLRPSEYVVFVDPSGGQEVESDKPDYHAIEVVDHHTKVQVAEYRSRIDPDLIGLQALLVALFFNEAWVGVERTGGWGGPILRMLAQDYWYPFVYRSKRVGNVNEKTEPRLGFSTDVRTKPLLIAGMQALIRTEDSGIRSRVLADEASTYTRTEAGKLQAEPGKYDDCLMAYMGAQYLAREIPPKGDGGGAFSGVSGSDTGGGFVAGIGSYDPRYG